MKKGNYYKVMYIISLLLVIGFTIRLGADYFKYDPIATSFPFSTYIILRFLEFIIPSILVSIVGIICKKKFSK